MANGATDLEFRSLITEVKKTNEILTQQSNDAESPAGITGLLTDSLKQNAAEIVHDQKIQKQDEKHRQKMQIRGEKHETKLSKSHSIDLAKVAKSITDEKTGARATERLRDSMRLIKNQTAWLKDISGKLGQMIPKPFRAAGKTIMGLIKGTIFAAMLVALLAFLESDYWKETKAFIVGPLSTGLEWLYKNILVPIGNTFRKIIDMYKEPTWQKGLDLLTDTDTLVTIGALLLLLAPRTMFKLLIKAIPLLVTAFAALGSYLYRLIFDVKKAVPEKAPKGAMGAAARGVTAASTEKERIRSEKEAKKAAKAERRDRLRREKLARQYAKGEYQRALYTKTGAPSYAAERFSGSERFTSSARRPPGVRLPLGFTYDASGRVVKMPSWSFPGADKSPEAARARLPGFLQPRQGSANAYKPLFRPESPQQSFGRRVANRTIGGAAGIGKILGMTGKFALTGSPFMGGGFPSTAPNLMGRPGKGAMEDIRNKHMKKATTFLNGPKGKNYMKVLKVLKGLGRLAWPAYVALTGWQAYNIIGSDDSSDDKAKALGGIFGGLIGAVTGAALGSVFGAAIGAGFFGIGAIPGAFLGGIIGGFAGHYGGEFLGTQLMKLALSGSFMSMDATFRDDMIEAGQFMNPTAQMSMQAKYLSVPKVRAQQAEMANRGVTPNMIKARRAQKRKSVFALAKRFSKRRDTVLGFKPGTTFSALPSKGGLSYGPLGKTDIHGNPILDQGQFNELEKKLEADIKKFEAEEARITGAGRDLSFRESFAEIGSDDLGFESGRRLMRSLSAGRRLTGSVGDKSLLIDKATMAANMVTITPLNSANLSPLQIIDASQTMNQNVSNPHLGSGGLSVSQRLMNDALDPFNRSAH